MILGGSRFYDDLFNEAKRKKDLFFVHTPQYAKDKIALKWKKTSQTKAASTWSSRIYVNNLIAHL